VGIHTAAAHEQRRQCHQRRGNPERPCRRPDRDTPTPVDNRDKPGCQFPRRHDIGRYADIPAVGHRPNGQSTPSPTGQLRQTRQAETEANAGLIGAADLARVR
jgi:hypothetical protein